MDERQAKAVAQQLLDMALFYKEMAYSGGTLLDPTVKARARALAQMLVIRLEADWLEEER